MRPIIILCLALVGCSAGARFDKTAWRDADLSGRERAEMLPDFLTRYPLNGRTRTEIIALLGEPTPTDKWVGTEMTYVLGNDGSYMAIDHEWLLIELDQRQKAVSFETVRD
ncbi:hypothetical protein [Allosphingosinicella deserti]|uniref:Lipoprotein SmpA/OmlA domain-containing protein n=1 Tax=Allosphingosinicella deserti TaxID=2116704 RepID=A0A2P7QSM9_9SPHN|nr:hypothetical protein [Sphingomonas deserti]PSJ40972.1 hypothetical protein C7I55_11985 [Sphingomonas deserti]